MKKKGLLLSILILAMLVGLLPALPTAAVAEEATATASASGSLYYRITAADKMNEGPCLICERGLQSGGYYGTMHFMTAVPKKTSFGTDALTGKTLTVKRIGTGISDAKYFYYVDPADIPSDTANQFVWTAIKATNGWQFRENITVSDNGENNKYLFHYCPQVQSTIHNLQLKPAGGAGSAWASPQYIENDFNPESGVNSVWELKRSTITDGFTLSNTSWMNRQIDPSGGETFYLQSGSGVLWLYSYGKLSFTLSAKDCIYDGKAHPAEVVDPVLTGSSITAAQLASAIKYYKNESGGGETLLDSAPIEIGDYTAKLDIAGISTSVSYKITKGTPKPADFVFTPPADLNYNGRAKFATVKVADGVVGMGTITVTHYKDPECTVKVNGPTKAGTYYVGITVTEGTNYKASTETIHGEDWLFTIKKIDPTAAVPTGLTATYGQTLADVSLENKNPEGNTPGKWTWMDSTQSVGDVVTPAATFKAKFTPTDTTNYNTLENLDVTVTVSKADPAAAFFVFSPPAELTYDASAKTATVTAAEGVTETGEITVSYYTDAACTQKVESAVGAGPYYVGITVAGGKNFNASTGIIHGDDWTFTIERAAPKAADFSFTAPADLNYSGSAKEATVTAASGIVGMGTVTVAYYKDKDCTQKVESAIDSIQYYVGITVAEGDNYKASTATIRDESWTFTVVSIDPTANPPTGLTAVYGQTLADVSLENKNPEGNTPGVWTWVDSTQSVGSVVNPPNTFKADFTPDDTLNYNKLEKLDVTVTVQRAAPVAADFSFTAPAELTYDAGAKEATVTAASGIVGMGTVTVAYYTDAACTQKVESAVNAGPYYVGITVAQGDNYQASTATIHDQSWTFTIEKAAPAAADFSFTAPADLNYSGSAKEATVTAASGIVGMGTVTVAYYTDAAWTQKVESAIDSIQYYVGITVTEGDNYQASTATIRDQSWTFTVVSIDPVANPPTGLTATYGETLADVSLENKNPQGNTPGVWTWADSTQSVGDVVTPPITFKADFTPDDTTNYNTVENVDVTVTVNKAGAVAATVTANDRFYDETEQPLVNVDASTLVGGTMYYVRGTDSVTVPTAGWSEDVPAAADVGSYYVWYKAVGDDNHNDTDALCVTVSIEIARPKIVMTRLALEGVLNLKYYVWAPDVFDGTGATMAFSIPNQTELPSQIVEFNSAPVETVNGVKYHVFNCRVVAYLMADTITATLTYKDGTLVDTYSVKAYLDELNDPDAEAVVDAMRNYGHYIQPYMKRLYPNIQYVEMPKGTKEVDVAAALAGSAAWLTDFTPTVDTNRLKDLIFRVNINTGTSLVFEFRLKDGVSGTVTAKVGAETMYKKIFPDPDRANLYRIEVDNIPANNLEIACPFSVKLDGRYVFVTKSSPMDYINVVLKNEQASEDEKLAIGALYEYWAAADDYANHHS